ncbi:MAG: 2-iminoacetate synthase ThiH [Oscillospiraceae bacterium]|nr:2-iminoacetate synthase ThiH [Oscillospiraceae bacterium]
MTNFDYLPGMQKIESDILPKVHEYMRDFSSENYTEEEVRAALACPAPSIANFSALLSPAAEPLLEEIARAAQTVTRRWHGNNVGLYTPLYLANYCDNHCAYCGFSCHKTITRTKLSMHELRQRAEEIAASGLQEVLVLTGESRSESSVEYIAQAITLLRDYFAVISIEIYPLNCDEYVQLQQVGADYVSVYQETYDPVLYDKLHLEGPKRCYTYRFYAQERALLSGMRGVSFGALLGLGDWRRDIFAAGLHAYFTQRKHPQAEIAFSLPRMRPHSHVTERELMQAMLALRLFMPHAGIAISTRERPQLRDAAVRVAATKMSAGVRTSVDEHNDPQFSIADPRSVAEIHAMLRKNDLQPVYLDYIR